MQNISTLIRPIKSDSLDRDQEVFRLSQLDDIVTELQGMLHTLQSPPQLRKAVNQLCSQYSDIVTSNEQLKVENEKLRRALGERFEDHIKLSDQAKRILQWLAKRNSESAKAIAFGVCVETTRAQNSLDELKQLTYVECVDKSLDQWKITEVGAKMIASLLN